MRLGGADLVDSVVICHPGPFFFIPGESNHNADSMGLRRT